MQRATLRASSSPGPLRRRAAPLSLSLLLVGAASACNAVLGLDAPSLAPCDGGTCVDATAPVLVDGSSPDGAPPLVDAGADAREASSADDAGPINGVRCGGGATTVGCAGSTPGCCLVLDGGTASYTCDEGAAACADGYPILCATNNDCSGSEVCCRFASSIKCEPESSCANDALVCDPDGSADQCPSGWKCDVAFMSGSYTLPYYGCSQ